MVANKTRVNALTRKYTKEQLQPVILLVTLVFLTVVFTCVNPRFMSWQNWHSVLLTAVTVGIISIGQSCCKIADYFDLSVGMVGSLGTLLVVYLLQIGWSFLPAMLAGIVLGIICGLLAGVLVAYLKMNSFITTFALQSLYRGIIYIFTDGYPFSLKYACYDSINAIGQTKIGGFIQLPIVVMLVLFVLAHLFLTYTRLGRSIFLVGGNQNCAHISGINVVAVQMFIFVLCDVLCVFAGVLFAGRMASCDAFLASTIPMESIAVAILGGTVSGRGNMFQTFLGVLIIFVVKQGLIMIGIPDFYQYIAVGLIFFVAVLLQTEHKKD